MEVDFELVSRIFFCEREIHVNPHREQFLFMSMHTMIKVKWVLYIPTEKYVCDNDSQMIHLYILSGPFTVW